MKQTNCECRQPHTISEALSRFRDSEHIALICADEELSYRVLLCDAEHIARVLMERGVKKGDRVLLQMRRSADYVRMYLGVVFAGAVKVTLHSDWPERQRTLSVEDCSPVMIVDDEMAKALRMRSSVQATPTHNWFLERPRSLPPLLSSVY